MNYFVTGGAGFLGSHLCERLIARGDNVLCLDNFFTGSRENVASLISNPRFELIRHDIVHPVFLEPTVADAEPAVPVDSAMFEDARATPLNAPWLTSSSEDAVHSEQFRVDREAFTLDLIRTGRITPMRARTIAKAVGSRG